MSFIMVGGYNTEGKKFPVWPLIAFILFGGLPYDKQNGSVLEL
jgi:hypothetical protein